MTWISPGMVWFGLLVPAVLLLWFLKIKRRDFEVSSTLLWAKVLDDKRVNSPFQRFRKSLLLLLQLLVIILGTLALMQPERRGEQVAGRAHVLLIDVSASMAVEEDGGSRLDLAKRLAKKRVDNMGFGERGVILAFDRSARAITPVTDDRDVLRRAINSLETTVAATDVGPAMELALSIGERQTDAVAVIYSDGNFGPWQGKQISLPLEYEPIGTREQNAGITSLSARPELGEGGGLSIFVEVRNPGTEPAAGTISLSLGGIPGRVVEVPKIERGGRLSHTFEITGEKGAGDLLEVVWEPTTTDRLAADDRAWIVVEPPSTVRVWQVGPPNFALDDALAVLPHTDVHAFSADEAKTRLESADVDLPDLIIWDRTAPGELPRGPSHLFLGALPPGVWDPPPESTEFPPIISWDQEHPLNRFVAYSSLDGEIPEGWILPDIPNSKAILDSRGGALIRTFRTDSSDGLVVSFDPMRTRWPLQTSFPFFLQAATSLLGRPVETVEGIRPGELMAIEGGTRVTRYRVTTPDGEETVVDASPDGWFRTSETDQLGLYKIRWVDPMILDEGGEPFEWTRIVPVSLLSLDETAIAPTPKIEIAGGELTEESRNRTLAQQAFWPWLIALGLLFLAAEWYFYHRR